MTATEKAEKRHLREQKEFSENLEKMKRLAGRKRLKAEHTLALQVALKDAKQRAWEIAGGGKRILEDLRPSFETAYEEFLLSAGFRMAWNPLKKQAQPEFVGFSFTQAVRYASAEATNPIDADIFRLCQGLCVGIKTEQAKAYADDVTKNWTDEDVDLCEMLEETGSLKPQTVSILLSENHLHRHVRANAYAIAKLVGWEHKHKIFTSDNVLRDDGYQWLYKHVRHLCVIRFNRRFHAQVLDDMPLMAGQLPDIIDLYTPKKVSSGGRSAYRHSIVTEVFDGVKRKQVLTPAIPTRETLEAIKEMIAQPPEPELR